MVSSETPKKIVEATDIASLFKIFFVMFVMFVLMYTFSYTLHNSTDPVRQDDVMDVQIRSILSDIAVLKTKAVHQPLTIDQVRGLMEVMSASIRADIANSVDTFSYNVRIQNEIDSKYYQKKFLELVSRLDELSIQLDATKSVHQNDMEQIIINLNDIVKVTKETSELFTNMTASIPINTEPKTPTVTENVTTVKPKLTTEMTLAERKERLTDLANLFTVKYERLKPKEAKKWHAMWQSMLEDRNGDLVILANERFLLALANLKGKKSEDIADKDIYEASKIYMMYDHAKLPLPTYFVEIMEEKEAKSYEKIVVFISGAVAGLE